MRSAISFSAACVAASSSAAFSRVTVGTRPFSVARLVISCDAMKSAADESLKITVATVAVPSITTNRMQSCTSGPHIAFTDLKPSSRPTPEMEMEAFVGIARTPEFLLIEAHKGLPHATNEHRTSPVLACALHGERL